MAQKIIPSRAYLEINLGNLKGNCEVIKSILPEGTELIAVVKANAYGHGILSVADALTDVVDAFAVATLDEAVKLRNNGIENDIIALYGVGEEQYEAAILNSVTLTVFSYEDAKKISRISKRLKTFCDCRIKLDTGMSRLGFGITKKDLKEVQKIFKLPNIKISGIYSHLASAGENEDFAVKQISRFDNALEFFLKKGVECGKIGILNSAGILSLKSYYSSVRCGIIMYGVHPFDTDSEQNVKPVMSVKARIKQIKTLPKGTEVGYGCEFVTNRNTKVAVLSIGYADGVPRSLAEKGYVLIRGQKAKIIGRICMDLMTVDITDIPDVTVNDVATLVGNDGDESITMTDMAKNCLTIPYEIMCSFDKERLTKLYIE